MSIDDGLSATLLPREPDLTRIERDFHNFIVVPAVICFAMKQAFVLQLGAGTDSTRRHFEGLIEEVDSGREIRFKSTEELLEFLAHCFERGQKLERERDGPLRE